MRWIVHPAWPRYPLRGGCVCRWLAGPAGWVMEACRLNCPSLSVHRGGG